MGFHGGTGGGGVRPKSGIIIKIRKNQEKSDLIFDLIFGWFWLWFGSQEHYKTLCFCIFSWKNQIQNQVKIRQKIRSDKSWFFSDFFRLARPPPIPPWSHPPKGGGGTGTKGFPGVGLRLSYIVFGCMLNKRMYQKVQDSWPSRVIWSLKLSKSWSQKTISNKYQSNKNNTLDIANKYAKTSLDEIKSIQKVKMNNSKCKTLPMIELPRTFVSGHLILLILIIISCWLFASTSLLLCFYFAATTLLVLL